MDYARRLLTVALLAVGGLASSAPALAANVIEGTSVAGANVSLSCWNYTTYKYPWQSTTASSTGAFAFNKGSTYGPCGSYYSGSTYTCKIYAYPQSNNSDYVSATSADFTPSCDSTTTITLSHAQKNKTIQVSLSDGVGAITSGITVYVSQSGGSYDYSSTTSINSNGVATLKAAEGKYYVGAYCSNYSNCDYSGSPNTYVTLGSADTSVSTTLTFKLNKSTLAVGVSDGRNPLSGVYVSAYTYSNGTSGYTAGTSSYVSVSGQTNSGGSVSLKVPEGTYTVNAYPAYGTTGYASASKEVTVGNAELLAVTMVLSSKTAPFTITVKDENGNPLSASVSGWTNDGGGYDSFWGQTSSASGTYTGYGVEGRKYQISAYYHSYSNGVANTDVCNYNTEGYQTAKGSTSGVSLAFTFPLCNHTTNFNLVDSAGAKPSITNSGGVDVKPYSQSSSDAYYAGIWASLTNNGAGSTKVRPNTKYTATLHMWDSSYVAGDAVTFTSGASNGTTDVSLTVSRIDASIKGSFVDASGNALSVSDVSYIYIYTTKDKAYRSCDIAKGSFTCNVSAGTWCLGYWVDYNSGYVSVSPGASTQCYAVASGESLSKNLTLLKTGSIIVTVKDPAGSPASNVWVEATATSAANYGSKKDNYFYGQGCSTNSNGTCTINVGAANEGTTYYVNAHMPYGILKEKTWTQPDEQSVTIAAGGSGEVILSFGKPDGQIQITIAQASASVSTKALRHASKAILKASGDDASVLENATVDIFSNSGAYATGTTDSNGTVTLNCTIADKWYAVAYHIFGNTLYMSEATEIACKKTPDSDRESVGAATVSIKETATLPECESKTFDASAAQTLGCTDGTNLSIPAAVMDSYGSTVTVNIDNVVTPFKSNERPANYFAKRVKATKSTGEEIITLSGYVTLVLPCSSDQLTKLGLALSDCKCKYNDPSLDAYKDVACVQDSSSCKVTITTNHLTDFVITGNGNLKGLDGTPEGVTPPEVGDTGGGSSASGGNSGSCGCRQGSGPIDLATILFGLLPFLPAIFLRRVYRTGVSKKGD